MVNAATAPVTPVQTKGGMPTWAKVLLGIFGGCFVIFGLIIGAIFMLGVSATKTRQEFVKNENDLASRADKIVTNLNAEDEYTALASQLNRREYTKAKTTTQEIRVITTTAKDDLTAFDTFVQGDYSKSVDNLKDADLKAGAGKVKTAALDFSKDAKALAEMRLRVLQDLDDLLDAVAREDLAAANTALRNLQSDAQDEDDLTIKLRKTATVFKDAHNALVKEINNE